MAVSFKDAVATVLTALAVLAFVATQEGWNVALIGDSHRWAAGLVLALGWLTCTLGRPAESYENRLYAVALSALGVAALALAVIAIWTGSLTALTLLVADIVLLWAASTARHARPRKAIPA